MPKREFDFRLLNLPFKLGDWKDADERMFHACFTILGQFVETELGPEREGVPDNAKHRGYRVHFEGPDHPKAIDLWLWYRDELPVMINVITAEPPPTDETLSRTAQNKALRAWYNGLPFSDDDVQRIQNERLTELMSIRTSLWT